MYLGLAGMPGDGYHLVNLTQTQGVWAYDGYHHDPPELSPEQMIKARNTVAKGGSTATTVTPGSTAGTNQTSGSSLNAGLAALQNGGRGPSAPGAFAMGGLVQGGIPGQDSVPIMAMAGERVLSQSQNKAFEAGQGGGKSVTVHAPITINSSTSADDIAAAMVAHLNRSSLQGFDFGSPGAIG